MRIFEGKFRTFKIYIVFSSKAGLARISFQWSPYDIFSDGWSLDIKKSITSRLL